jgi:hypothetical protein
MAYHDFRSILREEAISVNKNIYKRATVRNSLIYQPVYCIHIARLRQKWHKIIFAGKYTLGYTGKYGI